MDDEPVRESLEVMEESLQEALQRQHDYYHEMLRYRDEVRKLRAAEASGNACYARLCAALRRALDEVAIPTIVYAQRQLGELFFGEQLRAIEKRRHPTPPAREAEEPPDTSSPAPRG